MPFATIEDLPDNIRKLSVEKQNQFLAVFNSAFEDCDGDDCEQRAFAIANAAISKAIFVKLEELPDSIRKLSTDKQEMFMAAFNAAFEECEGDDCEQQAFVIANAAIAKAAVLFARVEDLPDPIRELPTAKQEMFMAAFNESIGGCDGDEADCRSQAFTAAHSAIDEGKAHQELMDDLTQVPDDVVEEDRKTYRKAYNAFYKNCMKGASADKAEGCSKGSHKAGHQACKQSKAGARSSAADRTAVQVIYDQAALLGASLTQGQMKGVQGIHDMALSLGAACGEGKALSLESQASAVYHAWYQKYMQNQPTLEYNENDTFIKEVYSDFIIVSKHNQFWKYNYTIDDGGNVAFGEPVQVEVVYQPVGTLKANFVWTCAVEGHEHKSICEARTCIDRTTLATPSVRTEFVKSLYSNNSLKTVAKTETELVVANYMCFFGGRDLEGIASTRKNGDGTLGEFFSKNTVFESDYTATGQLMVDWEHGFQPDKGPGRDDVLGYVDWKSAIIDDNGLWVQRVLNRRNKYVQFLEELLDAGLIGTSSEPVVSGVRKGTNGEIHHWPLKRDTLTVAPMDYRMLGENHLEVMKALSFDPGFAPIYSSIQAVLAEVETEKMLIELGENL